MKREEVKNLIKELNSKRNKIKAYLSYILYYMTKEKGDKPLKTTVMKVVYLLHSKYNIYFATFDSYLYGPYSRSIDSILTDLVNSEIVELESKISKTGNIYYIIKNAKFPKELEAFLSNDDKKKIEKSLNEIYNEFSSENKNKLSLDKLLKYVYNKDENYKNSEFGEPIEFEKKT